jgi:hypothetical protein
VRRAAKRKTLYVIMRDIGQVLTVSHMAFGVWIGDIVYAVSPI